MKFTLIAAVSVLTALAFGLALLDLTPRSTIFRPAITIVILKDYPDTAYHPSRFARVSSIGGRHEVRTFLGFDLPASTGMCTIGFSDANTATGSHILKLFTMGGYPVYGNTWNKKPYTDVFRAGFLVLLIGAGLTAVEDLGAALAFPCPTTPTSYGFEVRPVGDNDYNTWDITSGGFVITSG